MLQIFHSAIPNHLLNALSLTAFYSKKVLKAGLELTVLGFRVGLNPLFSTTWAASLTQITDF